MESRLASAGSGSSPIVVVAELEGKVQGVAGVSFFDILERAQSQARLSVIVVAPEARGRGVGEALVHEVEELARARAAHA